MYKIRWIKFIFNFIVCPIITGFLWERGYEGFVVAFIYFEMLLIMGYLNSEEFRK